MVRVHNDDITSALVVMHTLHQVCGHPWPEAIETPRRVHTDGKGDVATCTTQAEAEDLVVALQRRGLHATVWFR